MPCGGVAVVAQQPADLTGVVVVVDAEFSAPVPGRPVISQVTADSTSAALRSQELSVRVRREAVAMLDVRSAA